MNPTERHNHLPKISFDGADLDCGNGLLLLIRKHLDPLDDGELMEVRSTDTSVEEDLPAWCRLTGNELVSWTKVGRQRSYLICRGSFDYSRIIDSPASDLPETFSNSDVNSKSGNLQSRRKLIARPIAPLSVMGVGSWPRPAWLLPYLHQFLEGKIAEQEFNKVADDAARLAVHAQLRAGVSIVTDGESRRDNYASFVGSKLNGCQLIPLTDLLPLVDDPTKFKAEMQSIDVPADRVRHPAVFGKLSRRQSLAGSELEFLGSLADAPAKVAIPGPYLLTRMMWMDCITDKVYRSRTEIASDLVDILREEIAELIELGASLIQLDEPVLTEAVFTGAKNTRSFMCGALSERGSSEEELDFASELINAVCDGFPKDKLAMHVCRGNWTPDETVALKGSYAPLIPLFRKVDINRLILEFCTTRAGDLHILQDIREDQQVGLGVVNPKTRAVETVESIIDRTNECISLLGVDRITLNPDCGFATFADNPVNSAEIAEAKLKAAVNAAKALKEQHL